jgi:hypothetical protein
MAQDEANSAPAPYAKLAADLHRCALDYSKNHRSLTKEHGRALLKLLQSLADADEEGEQEPTEELIEDEPGPRDLPGGMKPIPGGGMTPGETIRWRRIWLSTKPFPKSPGWEWSPTTAHRRAGAESRK